MRVALLEGGRSLERGVSLRSGARVRDALARLGHDVTALDADSHLISNLRELRPEVAFIALHGREGEDGTVQQLLDLLGIPYTGSGPDACARTVDKATAKSVLRSAGLPTPDSITLDGSSVRDLGAAAALPEIGERLGWPMVVKPARGGSALGVSLASAQEQAPAAILAALSYDDRVLVERHVDGRDLAVAVIGSEGSLEALPVVEAVPQGDRYDFEARYEIGATTFECPAPIDGAAAARAAELAVAACAACGCRGVARVDILLDGAGDLSVIEVDTVPGMTQTSLVPLAAEAGGIGFDELVSRMLDLAIAND